MNEIKVYIANLGKYNEGLLVGEWFTLPVDFEEVATKIGLNEQYEEFAIHDYESPFVINEYDSLEKLNEIAERIANEEEYTLLAVEHIVDNGIKGNFLEALDSLEDGSLSYMFHCDCKDMSDVAYSVLTENGTLEALPELAQRYFDFEAYGRDLEIEGTFIKIDYDTYLEVLY